MFYARNKTLAVVTLLNTAITVYPTAVFIDIFTHKTRKTLTQCRTTTSAT